MEEILALLARQPEYRKLLAALNSSCPVRVSGLAGSARSLLVAQLRRDSREPILFLAGTEATRQQVHRDLQTLLPANEVLMLLPDAQSQLRLLNRLRSGPPQVIVTDSAALGARAIRRAPGTELEIVLRPGTAAARDKTRAWLQEAGYELTDLASEPGEFAVRGGIIDVFPDGANYPLRVEFMGDSVESLREFDPLTQRSVKPVAETRIEARATHEFSDATLASLLPPDLRVVSEAGTESSSQPGIILVAEDGDIDFGFRAPNIFLGNFELLKAEIAATRGPFFVVCADDYQRQRLTHVIGEHVRFVLGRLSLGFTGIGLTVLTEREIYGVPVMREPKRRFKGLPVDDLLALHKGDYVVHVNYGIGMFEGIKRLKVEGREHDFLHIRYADNGRVYVPIENLGLIDRYIGAEDRAPGLDRLSSKSWQLAKTRTVQAVADYAEELLAIYARREVARGFGFARDTPWQRELEDAFVHEETADQLKAIAEVKRDMESTRPMDRLVCGDVGYGKTEVALRAAFKAVMDAKQVAVLVPTTILAYQHYNTFTARLATTPVKVAMLSRFVPPGRRALAVQDLKQGKVDIVIGTHMLLSKKVEFKDLGLLVIDEEQKFGVRQKEDIKRLKASLDVLTLSATPIPRTLYMSLVGLRDISTIHTPPAGRREIETEVQPWHEETIRRYILREVERGGQVFFIHNRVESLKSVYNRLCRLCPELRIAMAHGQMAERMLANVYLNFADGAYDVLISTAIIESGLDLPRVNTIIVNRADWFGLADLHQLRGRVGRTQEQAYALFIIPDQHDIAPEARKRLSSILAYSQLGSGFKLAMRDMEIRGVGNLLGTEQHGHVTRVGFNLYVHLLKEAVSGLKGEEVAPEPELALDIEAYIPETYITDSYERVAIYKRLLSTESENELDSMRDELKDRFGKYPAIVETLFRVALVRVYARRARLLRVGLRHHRISLVSARGERIIEGGLERLLEALKTATADRRV
jgi:transcription-repair coupling factor (superfamily II helicase)